MKGPENDRWSGVGSPDDADAQGEQMEDGAWERMIAAFRQAAPSGDAPAWLEQKVMSEIDHLPEPGALSRFVGWLTSPRPIRISPLTAAIAVAGLAAVLLLPGRSTSPDPMDTSPVAGSESETVVYVQFMLDAPGATSVAVAGDFSEWQPSFTLEDPDQDGVWTGRVPVSPGVHAYMFVIDGTEWQTDPRAQRYQDDGFGNQNAVLAVGTS